MAWKAAAPGGGAARSPLSPFPSPPAPPAQPFQEEQQDEEAAAAALAISDRRTLYLVNIFVGSAARFLNSFAAVCEDKLADVHRRILRLDSTLRLLEAKLCGTSGSFGAAGAEEDRELEREKHPLSSSSSSAPAPPLPDSPPDHLGTSSVDSPTGF